MFSFLGNYTYSFPTPTPLNKRLKDYLEDHPELEEDITLTIDYLKEMKEDIKKCSEFLKIYCFEKMF